MTQPSIPWGLAVLGEDPLLSSQGFPGTLPTEEVHPLFTRSPPTLLLGPAPLHPPAPWVCSRRPLCTGPRGSCSFFAHQRKEPVLTFALRARKFGKSKVGPRTRTFPRCRWVISGWIGCRRFFSRVRSSQAEIFPSGFCAFYSDPPAPP